MDISIRKLPGSRPHGVRYEKTFGAGDEAVVLTLDLGITRPAVMGEAVDAAARLTEAAEGHPL